MTHGAATAAIVGTRLRKELRMLLLSSAACGLLAYLQRYDDALAQFAGCLVFGTLAGIAVALLQRGGGRFRELELCEQSAPLYGRELARATALVPCIIVGCACALYWVVNAWFAQPQAQFVLVSAAATGAATLTALCATLRKGAARILYVLLACALGILAFALLRWVVADIAACVAAGFVALRQYGEALARYDPV
jgi:hypothetical protein